MARSQMWLTVVAIVSGCVAATVGLPVRVGAQGTCADITGKIQQARDADTAGASHQAEDTLGQPVVDIGALSGRRIVRVNVITLAPDPLPGAAARLDGLHVRTRSRIVQRELLFAVGDTVDSLRVAESLRRLRHLRYLADVRLTSSPADTNTALRACRDSTASRMAMRAGVALTITTRDAWSTRPSMRIGAGTTGSFVGIEDHNVAGTGRVMKVYLRNDNGRLGAGVAYVDPWLFGRDIIGSVSRDVFRNGASWQTAVRTHQRSVFDPWVVELALARRTLSTYGGSRGANNDTTRQLTAHLLFDRLLTESPFGATRILFGVETEHTREEVPPTASIVGPFHVHRSFAGIDVGVARHAGVYESNDWLLPRRDAGSSAIADIPDGAEGEILTAIGRDFLTGGLAIHVDAWEGRAWSLGHRSLLTVDTWQSGFRGGLGWTAASIRGAVGAYRDGERGLWIAHLAAEQLTDPDPTVRALRTFDPTVASLPSRSGLAESAIAGSLERTVHLRPVTRSYMLDVAAFGAGSFRWDPAPVGKDQLGVVAIGAGLRLSPLRQGLTTLRLDVGLPVVHSSGVASRPFVALSIQPWLDEGRQRDGRGRH